MNAFGKYSLFQYYFEDFYSCHLTLLRVPFTKHNVGGFDSLKGNLSKLEAKNDNLRNDIEIMNIFRMYSFESTIPTNSSLRPNMNPIRAVLRCIGLYKSTPRKYLRFDPLTGEGAQRRRQITICRRGAHSRCSPCNWVPIWSWDGIYTKFSQKSCMTRQIILFGKSMVSRHGTPSKWIKS